MIHYPGLESGSSELSRLHAWFRLTACMGPRIQVANMFAGFRVRELWCLCQAKKVWQSLLEGPWVVQSGVESIMATSRPYVTH